MTRTEYLAELDKYLKRFAQSIIKAMDYFVEYFEEAGPEHGKRQSLLNWVHLKKSLAMSSRQFLANMWPSQ